MCGIAGFIGNSKYSDGVGQDYPLVKDILFASLEALSYRGYDSSGMSLLTRVGEDRHSISLQKSAGKLSRLRPLLNYLPDEAVSGIAHTRWATHGPPTSINAHPHRARGLALVHNGIIENHQVLKDRLLKEEKVSFLSQTDSEVALWCLVALLRQGLSWRRACMQLMTELQGHFSLVILCDRQPQSLVVLKKGSPLVLGFASWGSSCASDVLAFGESMDEALFLEDGEIGALTGEGYESWTSSSVSRADHRIKLTARHRASQKGEYAHFMYKEIHEQPVVLQQMLQRLVCAQTSTVDEDVLGLPSLDLARVTHIHLVGCGSAYYAATIGRYQLEAMVGIPAQAERASEYRYRSPLITPHTLVIAVSQSGETADTLACVSYARAHGAQVWSVCNVAYSSIARAAHAVFLMDVGQEVGVASTKAFTAQVLSLYMLSMALVLYKGLPLLQHSLADLMLLPECLRTVFVQEDRIQQWAQTLKGQSSCLFVGRHIHAAIACEGALKLKEISYLHAEAYPAGELKHGPLALIDAHMCVIALAPCDEQFPKILSNIEEICARGGRVFMVCTHEDAKLRTLSEDRIVLHQVHKQGAMVQSLAMTLVLQLLSYHVAVQLGRDVDQPRNLAKSVTVE